MTSLDPYRTKRDFSRSPEPPGCGVGEAAGEAAAAGGARSAEPPRRFVVQRHRARRLHYDLRFEIGGVLVSWAVPKGPTLDPASKRLAVHVEDHPLEYADFEGVIPAGEYGGGDVIVWDRGTWEPHGTDDPAAAVAAGELHAEVHGEKLAGRLVLIRRDGGRGRRGERDGGHGVAGEAGREQWLLFHKRDDHAVAGWDPEAFPRSVKSGRTNEEIAAGRDALWLSGAPAARAEVDLSGAADEELPAFVPPMDAVPVLTDRRGALPDWAGSTPTGGDRSGWRYELDWGGLRVQARIDAGRVELRDAGSRPVGDLFPELVGPPTWLRGERALLDGVVVAVDGAGRPSYPLLGDVRRRAGGSPRGPVLPVVYQVFDLLHLDGRGLRGAPLASRVQLLGSVIRDHRGVRLVGSVEGEPADLLAGAAEAGLCGLLARRLDGAYRAGEASPAWSALRIRPEGDFLICGWEPEGDRARRDEGSGGDAGNDDGRRPVALLVAAPDPAGRPVYAGRVEDGLDDQARAVLAELLASRSTARPEVSAAPRTRGVRWVRPDVVARCRFTARTSHGRLRGASLLGVAPTGDRPSAPRRAPPAPRPRGGGPAELDRLGDKGRWHVGGRQLALTNLDKVLFPGRGGGEPLTKRDLVRYYAAIAPVMVPYLVDRPLNMHRYPDGVERGGFWHKELPAHAPAWLRRWRNEEADPGETQVYLVVDSPAALVWAANYGAVELHAWTSCIDDVHRPSYALIDIDPGDRTTFEQVVLLANLYRTALDHLGVRGWPKVTGQRGIQIWVPVERRYTFAETRGWVERLSRAVGSTVPELVSWAWEVRARRGLARLDYTQNAINKTLVAPYSVRPAAGAPVSMPIRWEELDDPDLRPDRWTIVDAAARVAEVGDLFAGVLEHPQSLPEL